MGFHYTALSLDNFRSYVFNKLKDEYINSEYMKFLDEILKGNNNDVSSKNIDDAGKSPVDFFKSYFISNELSELPLNALASESVSKTEILKERIQQWTESDNPKEVEDYIRIDMIELPENQQLPFLDGKTNC